MRITKQIGEVSVDSGLIVLCDPCYIWNNVKRRQNDDPPAIEREVGDYEAMCDSLDGIAHPVYKSYDGLGVVVTSGYGDGTYPVYAAIEDGHICSVTIDFEHLSEEEEDGEEDDYDESDDEEDDTLFQRGFASSSIANESDDEEDDTHGLD